MAITKQKVVSSIQIEENGTVGYRETTRVYEDGELLAEKHFRTTIQPGEPKQGHPKLVKDVIDLVHTPEVIAAYEAIKVPPTIVRV